MRRLQGVSCRVIVAAWAALLFSGVATIESQAAETWANIFKSTVQDFVADNSNRTLGGMQVWTDEFVFRGWRIQRNALTGHYRLLDAADRRQANGTYEECHERFETLRTDLALDPIKGRVVILVHGMTGQRSDLRELAVLLKENCQLTTIEFGYASTRASLDDHAAALAKVVERLGPDVDHIDFVGFSMGNLVIRRYLFDHEDDRVQRFVMIGPPNQGAELANLWADHPLFLPVVGAATYQMGPGWEHTVKKLAVPRCEFGIIAGCGGRPDGYSAKLPGDDDLVVSVATTRLAGAHDTVELQSIHHFLPSHHRCREYVLRFLQKGHFITDEERKPIAAEEDQ